MNEFDWDEYIMDLVDNLNRKPILLVGEPILTLDEIKEEARLFLNHNIYNELLY